MNDQRKERRRKKHRWMFVGNIMIRLVMAGSFAAAIWPYFAEFEKKYYFILIILLIYLVVYECFARLYKGFKSGNYRVSEIVIAHVLSLGAAGGCGWLACCLFQHNMINVAAFLLCWLIQAVFAIFWAWTMNKIYFFYNIPKRVLIISDAQNINVFLTKVKSRKLKFEIVRTAGGRNAVKEIDRWFLELDGVILYEVSEQYRSELLSKCIEYGIRVYMVPALSDIQMRSMRMVHILDTPMMMYEEFKLNRKRLLVKRATDIVLSGLFLVILAPVFFVVAVAVKLEDGGPVFFVQDRCTLDLKVFKIIKFRSMKPGADKLGPIPVTENDSRITRVGRIIRALRIDELPQLLNILKGDMSIVGPRPERLEYVKEYTSELPEFVLRSRMRGGLTGYAQVYGKYNTSPYDKLAMDLIYIENWSLLLDMKLILLTVKVCLKKESTEAFTGEAALQLSRNAGDKEENYKEHAG